MIAEIEDVCEELCDDGKIIVYGRVGNQGIVDVADTVSVELYGLTPNGNIFLNSTQVTGPFVAGKMIPTFELEAYVMGLDIYGLTLTVDGGNASEGVVFECNEDNDEDMWTDPVCK
jgi:hypothetical protein